MKGKLFMTLFSLPFAGVGVWMLWSVGTMLHDAWQMRDWVQVEAQLTSGGYESHYGEDTYTYEAYATYRYRFEGREYTGNRVTLDSGADNIGDYQKELGRKLQHAYDNRNPVPVYVDPDAPSQSVIDREIRWGMVGFKSIFVVVFGGAGFGLLFVSLRKSREKDTGDPAYADKPWLLNDAWQTGTVRSSSRCASTQIVFRHCSRSALASNGMRTQPRPLLCIGGWWMPIRHWTKVGFASQSI